MSKVFDDIIRGIPKQSTPTAQPRLTTPLYRKSAVATQSPPLTDCKSAPLPFSSKASLDVNKGIVQSYLTRYFDPTTGELYIDSYLDAVQPGSFKTTISTLNQERKARNSDFLCPYLWQHKRELLIGGVVDLAEESLGVVYTAKLNMDAQLAREAFSFCSQKMVASSYGYDAVKYQLQPDKSGTMIRHLLEVRLHETSLVSTPANPFATVLDVKSRHYIPHQYGRISALSAQMTKAFDTLETQLKSMHSSFPALPGDEYQYAENTELGIVDLLADIRSRMR